MAGTMKSPMSTSRRGNNSKIVSTRNASLGKSQKTRKRNDSLDKTIKNLPEERPLVEYKDGHTYKGEWLGDLKHGYGVFCWKNGSRYEGDWKNGYASGIGKYYYPEGTVYQGMFARDEANGYG